MSTLVAALVACALAGIGVPGIADAAPPEGRNYELVSLPNIGVNAAVPVPGGYVRASEDGRHIVFPSAVPLPGSPAGGLTGYLASREPDRPWSVAPVTPTSPLEAFNGTYPGSTTAVAAPMVFGTTPDLSRLVYQSWTPIPGVDGRPLAGLPPTNYSQDFYLRGPGGDMSWISRPVAGPPYQSNVGTFEAVTAGSGVAHVAFRSPEAMDPDYPAAANGLYVWSEGDDHARLVGLDQTDVPLAGATFVNDTQAHGIKKGALSSDGRRVVFKGGTTLYVRVDDTTIPIVTSTSQRFEGATGDVSTVFFRANLAIPGTTAPASGGVYAYNVPADGNPANGSYEFLFAFPTTSLTQHGVAAISDDGQHIYYVARTAGIDRLWHYDRAGGTSTEVAVTNSADGLLSAQQTRRPIRVTPDGRFLAFESRAAGIGTEPYDNGGHAQVFRYDADSGDPPVCVSCRPAGQTSTSRGVLSYNGHKANETNNRPNFSRNLSDDGRRLFFMTDDPLAAEDTNGALDVYEWRGGRAQLISGGKGPDSYFLDASADGDDVFFTSFYGLVPQHSDGASALYNAREGAPPAAALPVVERCAGDVCQGQNAPPLPLPSPRTSVPGGEGNLVGAPGRAVTFSVEPLSAAQRRSFARTGRATLAVTASAAGTVRAQVTARVNGQTRTVARASRAVKSAGQTVELTLRLSAAARRQVRSARSLPLRIAVSHANAKTAKTMTMTLRLPSRAAKRAVSRKGAR